MRYINYKSEENSIYVCKGHSKSLDNLKYENENFEILNDKNVFKGIKIKEFLVVLRVRLI